MSDEIKDETVTTVEHTETTTEHTATPVLPVEGEEVVAEEVSEVEKEEVAESTETAQA